MEKIKYFILETALSPIRKWHRILNEQRKILS